MRHHPTHIDDTNVAQFFVRDEPEATDWEYGFSEGRADALSSLDHAELIHLFDGLDRGPEEFVRRLKLSSIAAGCVPDLSFRNYVALQFGAASGGLSGGYFLAYVAGFEAVRPFLRSRH